ncbi:MAG TPA: 2-amino-4-hydroxy-6-hydroxymethyldihydropteridine diphosphokinase [Rhodanobacteraceae bacterium]|jgi:2-amino-4-hydroxy-6-hydroxymethyldihydropteridine diphosphokinase|nr:2-amino-4-hydroxy-6-hydroxymethyldihydropteridine diphosphokinase [Rhodanobacteraceae bacterium]
MARVYLSLGSNVDAERHLADALRALRERFGAIEVSPTYRSAAVGFEGAAFLNNAAAFDCDLDRDDLRVWLRALEDASGRDRNLPRYADRTLDLDVALWCDGGACETDLSREEFERAHVLAPLADLAPDLREPFTGTTLRERWQELAPTLPKLERLDQFPD